MKFDLAKWTSIAAGGALVALLLIGLGAAWHKYRFWPYEQVRSAAQITLSLLRHGEVVADNRRVPAPLNASRALFTIHATDLSIREGFFAFMGWDGEGGNYAVWLYDTNGNLLHQWPIVDREIAGAEHNSNVAHPLMVMPDGDILIGFDRLNVMARLDACGDVVWTRQGTYHHSFAPSADGNVWTWYGGPSAYGQTQYILKFDPGTGETVQRISLQNDVIMRDEQTPLIFSLRSDYFFPPPDAEQGDFFHPNDVEELLPDMADAFPIFEAGDLMLSLRNQHMILVIDQTGRIKWYQAGPWLQQHDPDFESDGRITVYNNATTRPRSSLLSLDPETREVRDALPDMTYPFKSEFQGKHQRLPNGNVLLTIPEQGQVLELGPTGELIMEFNNVAHEDDPWNESMAHGIWLPSYHFETMPSCSG